jgi:transglutaminase-like putative cysteine protease
MIGNSLKTVVVVIALIVLAPSASAQRVPPDLVVSNPRTYEVAITSRFVVPRAARKLTAFKVWHALPTARPWDGQDRTLGASGISFEPETGGIVHRAGNESQSVYWDVHEGLGAAKTFEFVSRFRVRSADRTYDYRKSVARWTDYYRLGDSKPDIDRDLDTITDGITTTHSPAASALEFCKWVTEHIKYDASVPYEPGDLPSILKERKGHCGHQITAFAAMCDRAGIPTRAVLGLNLNTPGGTGELHKVRPDFENQHTWAQIYLPGSGWIEIDPGMGAKAYFLPAQVIQNSTDMQNYSIWVCANEEWNRTDWERRDGRWYSPYGIENRRSFRVVEP